MDTSENIWPPVRLAWVEDDPAFVPGYIYLAFKYSGIKLFGIHKKRQNLGWFGPAKYKFELATDLRVRDRDGEFRRLGGYYDTLEEAKDQAEKLATFILRGLNFDPVDIHDQPTIPMPD